MAPHMPGPVMLATFTAPLQPDVAAVEVRTRAQLGGLILVIPMVLVNTEKQLLGVFTAVSVTV